MVIKHVVFLITSLTIIRPITTSRRIGGGVKASISKFPHSLFLKLVDCGDYDRCGGSILTQDLLLTAANCFVYCKRPIDPRKMEVSMGRSKETRGDVRKIVDFITHQKFSADKFANDIALGKVDRPMNLGQKIMKVILMSSPPFDKPAYVAGWGSLDENGKTSSRLRYIRQDLKKMRKCEKRFGADRIAEGTFCMQGNKTSRPFEGDTGAALMVEDYIQIGIVSWGHMEKSYHRMIYTNVSYHLDWIDANSRTLACRS